MSCINSKNVELELRKIFDEKSTSFLILETDIHTPTAIFSLYNDAVVFLIRLVMNNYKNQYIETINDENLQQTEESYKKFVLEYIKNYFAIIPVNHLNLEKPIFVCRKENFYSKGEPTDYLTNSEEIWAEKMVQEYSCIGEDFNEFRLDVNPDLPELEKFEEEN